MPVRSAGSAEPNDPRHVDRDGDRSERRGRAGGDRQRNQHRHEYQQRHDDEPGGHVHLHGAASRRVHRRSGGHRLQAQPPDRHHPADRGNLAAGHPARSRRGKRRGQRGQPGPTGSQYVQRAGAGDRLQADSVAPAQWTALPAAHHADPGCDPGRVCRLRRESRGRRRAQRRPPQRERPAVVGQQLPARRRGEQRAAQRVREHHAATRGAAGIQGPDEQPDRRVRCVRRRRRQLEHPLGYQPVQRLGVRVLPRRIAQRAQLLLGNQGALQLAPVRRDVRRPDAAQQGVLLRRLPAPPAGPGPHRDCDGPDRARCAAATSACSARRSSIR